MSCVNYQPRPAPRALPGLTLCSGAKVTLGSITAVNAQLWNSSQPRGFQLFCTAVVAVGAKIQLLQRQTCCMKLSLSIVAFKCLLVRKQSLSNDLPVALHTIVPIRCAGIHMNHIVGFAVSAVRHASAPELRPKGRSQLRDYFNFKCQGSAAFRNQL